MIKAYKEFFVRYFDFKGKTGLAGYWWVVLINVIISVVLGVLGNFGSVVSSIYSLVILIPGIAVVVRRLRDAGKSPFNLFWLLLPIVGWIILIVYLASKSN